MCPSTGPAKLTRANLVLKEHMELHSVHSVHMHTVNRVT